MKNTTKLVGSIVIAAVLVFLVAGCASIPASAMLGPGNFYSDTAKVGEKRGEETGRVYLGIFGKESFPPVERVAKANEIKKIATVEHYAKLGILGIWMDYTTIVTGE
jgi:hypothetical protein